MEIKVIEKRVDIKTRKLKATWTVEYDDVFRLPSNEFGVVDNFDYYLPYGLDCWDVSFGRLLRVREWLEDTLPIGTYQLEYKPDNNNPHKIWLGKEKYRSMLLLKWNGN